jgi:putative transposase
MQCPAEVDQPFTRPYRGLPDIDYPFHDKTVVVTAMKCRCIRSPIQPIEYAENARQVRT